jgi:hypothetical protein
MECIRSHGCTWRSADYYRGLNCGHALWHERWQPAGFGRVELAPGMTYANIATSGGVEARLGGASGGPGFFNKAAFVAPPAMSPTGTVYYSIPGSSGQAQCAAANPGITCGTLYGNSGPGIILGPGQFNFDISILKTTAIRENHMIQFRAEFFNTFNHPQFSNPNSARAPSTVCRISRRATSDRSHQPV